MTRRHTVELSLLAALLLVFCLACARIPANVIPRPEPGIETDVVDYITHIISSHEWERTQWYRVGDAYDMTGFFVVSTAGSICLYQDGSWVNVRHGEAFACHGGWRPRANGVGSTGTHVSR